MSKITNKILCEFFKGNRTPYLVLSMFMMLLLSSCDNSYTYVISEQDSLLKVSHTDSLGVVIMAPKVKYAMYTFVIDSSNNVFFYSMPAKEQRGGVYDEPEPDSLGLLPNHILVIPKGTEKSFFEEKILKQKSEGSIKNIMLASFKDTITVSFLKYLKAISQDKQNKVSINIRLALPEERKIIIKKIKRLH